MAWSSAALSSFNGTSFPLFPFLEQSLIVLSLCLRCLAGLASEGEERRGGRRAIPSPQTFDELSGGEDVERPCLFLARSGMSGDSIRSLAFRPKKMFFFQV